jgi:hypothetical protein
LFHERIDVLLEWKVHANSDRPIALGSVGRDRSLVGRLHEPWTAAGDDVAVHLGEGCGDALDLVVDERAGLGARRAEDRDAVTLLL